MTRWTKDEWVVCLGAGWHKSFWDGRGGVNFKLETNARRECGSSPIYQQRVQRLRWVAFKNGEKGQSVNRWSEPSVSEPWSALALFQSQILAASNVTCTALGDKTNTLQEPQEVSKVIS